MDELENGQAYNAYQSRGIRGYGPSNLYPQQLDVRSKSGRAVLIVLIVLIVIAAIIIGVILWRRRTTSTTNSSTTGNDGGGGNTNTGCSTAGCTGGKVCDTATETCVACLADSNCSGATPTCDTTTHTCKQCLSNTNCSGTTPICDTATFTCKQCIVSADCPGSGTCDGGNCCNPGAPTILTVTPSTSADSQVTITYTAVQTGPGYSNVQVEVNIETPSGALLKALLKTASGGTVTVSESELLLPNQHLFSAVGYQVRLRMNYTCGSSANVNTPYSAASGFTMPGCSNTTVVANQGAGNGADNPAFSTYHGIVLRFFQFTSPFDIGVIADVSTTVHPNLAAVYYPLITTTAQIGQDNTYQYAPIPYPGPVGSTYQIRYFNIADPSVCVSALSANVPFFRGF